VNGASVECKLALCLAGSTVKAGLTYTHVNGSISEKEKEKKRERQRDIFSGRPKFGEQNKR
jgi:hypothetical protein